MRAQGLIYAAGAGALWVYMALAYNPAYWLGLLVVALMVARWELWPFAEAWWIRRTGRRVR